VLGTEDECKNPRMMAQLLTEHSVDLIQMTPSKMSMLQAIDSKFRCLNAVKRILVGGEQFPLQLLRDLQNFTQATIYNMYGPTETTIWSTVSDLTGKSAVDIGIPLKQTQLYLINENFRLITDCQAGEICIAGPCLADGYYNNPQKTSEVFITLPELPGLRIYRTGDLGRRNSTGRFEWLGRRDNQVKIRGHRIELEGLESVMDACSNMLKSVALVYSNGGADQLGLIYYSRGDELTESDLKIYARYELPEYMIPNLFIRGNKIYYTDNGKLDRRLITEYHIRELEMLSNTGQKTGADSDVVLRIVSDCLLAHNVNQHSRLVDIGMDSLAFVKIIVSLEEQFDFEFENEALSLGAFEQVRDLIDYVEAHKSCKIKELKL
jgi:acyl-CoA synthetase (AMP-forming)/AMP-acid ligase II/acyl carrier protein